MRSITVKAPVNIAVIKYWGKKDEDLIIPLNDSISGTLCMEQLCSTTTITLVTNDPTTGTANTMLLNGKEVSIDATPRLVRALKYVHEMVGKDQWPENAHLKIVSDNNFPTAAGLASSASGYAALLFGLCQLFNIDDSAKISALARLGSGSACRSLYGGFVQWIAGTSHETSIATQILDEQSWPEMRVLILVANADKKDTPSTSGMQNSAKTSTLITYRVENVLPQRVQQMITAIRERNFEVFARLTMQDSNQFHAICQDSYPPIRYMSDVSWSIVKFVHFFNQSLGKTVVAYTFDAGPNACLYCLNEAVPNILSAVQQLYPPNNSSILEIKGIVSQKKEIVDSNLLQFIEQNRLPWWTNNTLSALKSAADHRLLSKVIDSRNKQYF